MSDDRVSGSQNWSFSELQRIDAICDEFERAWNNSARLTIEQLLADHSKLPRASLLDPLLRLELHLRRATEKPPVFEEYVQRFPTDGSTVARVWRDFAASDKEEFPSTITFDDLARAPSPLPERIGRFLIRRLLGRGGFGAVYLAYDPDSQCEVALKVPHPQVDREGIRQEGSTGEHLNHPHLVRTLSIEEADGQLVIVQQFIDGQNLMDWHAQASPTPEQVVRLLIPVAQALGYLHEKGFVHRDLKPGNILVDKCENACIVDFGLALHEAQQRNRNRRGELAGTYAYMAPEQVRRQVQLIDGQSDLWSFGVILYRLLTDRFPFGGPPPRDTADQSEYIRDLNFEIEEHDPRPPRQINPAVSRKIEKICLGCLEKRKRDRYQTGHDLAEDLRLALGVALEPSRDQKVQIVPRGLRSFDAADAAFFLELIPGPRTMEDIPVSLSFWKNRLSDTGGHGPIDVGVVYGPSGCGKSSLVKAGLIPLLGDKFVSLVIESTPDDTEVRLLKAMRNAFPNLPRDASLLEATRYVGERGGGSGRKVLLIFDQFEQWLHAHPGPAEYQLLAALRGCNGIRLQALLLVRDDFWMPLTRFMEQLEIPLQENNNIAAVDLFDYDHARKVLLGIGRAYRRLPGSEQELTAAQQQFLASAVEGLAEDRRIICVRLALFAEMMKDRPWTPEELATVGGAKGIGVAFLEEKFGSKAPAVYKLHRAAVRKILEALLPPYGSNLKGQMRTVAELRQAAGSASASSFEQLLRILDTDLKLLTPVVPDQPSGKPDDASTSTEPLHFQLTHDYLVPSVREWLTTDLRRTPSGRALLRLRERSDDWNGQPESRRLPSLIEWLSIWRHIPRRSLSPAQRRMMTTADRRVFTRIGLATAIVILVLVAGSDMRGRSQAQALHNELLSAATSKVPGIAAKTTPVRRWSQSLLERTYRQEFGPGNRPHQLDDDQFRRWLHLVLVLGQSDPDKLTGLFDELIRVPPEDLAVVIEMLDSRRQAVVAPLEERLAAATAKNRAAVLPLASMLAWADRENVHLREAAEEIARQLRDARPTHFPLWLSYMKPIAAILRRPLIDLWQDIRESRGSPRTQLVEALALLGADDPATLVTAIQDCEPVEFAIFIPPLRRLGKGADDEFSRPWNGEDVKTSPPRRPSPIPRLSQQLRDEFETGGIPGYLDERGAVAVALVPEKIDSLNNRLFEGGFRLVSLRPYRLGSQTLFTATWHRDSREFHVEVNQTTEAFQTAIEQNRRNQFHIVDVAFDIPRESEETVEPRWCGVWMRTAPGDPATSLDIDVPFDELKQRMDKNQKEGLRMFRYVARADARNQFRYTAIWHRLAPREEDLRTAKQYIDPPSSFTRTRDATTYGDLYPGYLQTDLRAQASQGKLEFSGVWRSNQRNLRSQQFVGQSAGQLMKSAERLSQDGYLPIVVEPAAGPGNADLTFASFWHLSLASPEARSHRASQIANRALAAAHCGNREPLQRLMSDDQSERDARSFAIERIAHSDYPVTQLESMLATASTSGLRRAVILALGGYSPTQVSFETRAVVRKSAASAPEAAIRSAANWCVNRWAEPIENPDKHAAAPVDEPPANWYFDTRGHMMIRLKPQAFLIGSPEWEPDREGSEQQQWMHIPRTFSLAATAVTVAQFRVFLEDASVKGRLPLSLQTLLKSRNELNERMWHQDCPQASLRRLDAMLYCEWLSEQEGILENDRCYADIWEFVKNASEINWKPSVPSRSKKPNSLGFFAATGWDLPAELPRYHQPALSGPVPPLPDASGVLLPAGPLDSVQHNSAPRQLRLGT